MNKYILLFLLSVFLISCQSKLNIPSSDENNLNLNSLLTLEIGQNKIYLQDFVLDLVDVDSVTTTSEFIDIQTDSAKSIVLLDVDNNMEQMIDLQIWIDGVAFSVPCRKTDKVDYTYTFNPQAKTYTKVQIAGQMNDWTPSRFPAMKLNKNGMYEISMQLSPGSYLYQIALDGDQNHDANNPSKVDNGFGKFNSILQITGKNDSFPVLTTKSFTTKKISLSTENEVNTVFAYWQNIRLPDKFIDVKSNLIDIKIPENINVVERSFIRIWASNRYGVSNDILVPLQNGSVLTEASLLKREDKHAQIMYFMLIDRFKNGNKDNDKPLNRPDVKKEADFWGGDIAGLQQQISNGYFEKLGVNTLWISPLNENPVEAYGFNKTGNTKFSGYHGYWPVSSSKVDFRFGTNDELKSLVNKAHEKDMNILLDYVANHVHQEHPFYKNHPELVTKLILPDGTLNVAKWDEHRLTTWFDTFMPSLDYSNPKVVEMMSDSAMFWLKEFKIDGFRHDACKHINEEFWRTLSLKMKREMKGKLPYQIGETYGSSKLIASYLTTGMLDGQFDFNVYDIANSSFAGMSGGDLTRVKDVFLSSLNIFGSHNLMGYISGNHDKPRFMALASGDLKPGEDSKVVAWTRKIGITDSTAYDKMFLFHAFNLTIPGIPVIYYGDEIGMTGANDPDSRRMMRFEGWNNREVKIWNNIATLTNLRKNNAVLIFGGFINIQTTPATWMYARKYFDKEAIVIINNSPKTKEFDVALPKVLKAKKMKATFGNNFNIKEQKIHISLPAYSVEVLIN